ncbi:hypothetical protein TURU_100499 [Turdus rufiventris]|nr:hypothetical protein TURU_100499 [Turdus rufiventris]
MELIANRTRDSVTAFSAETRKDGGEALLHKPLGQSISAPLQDFEEHEAGMVGMSKYPGLVDEMYEKRCGSRWNCRTSQQGRAVQGYSVEKQSSAKKQRAVAAWFQSGGGRDRKEEEEDEEEEKEEKK